MILSCIALPIAMTFAAGVVWIFADAFRRETRAHDAGPQLKLLFDSAATPDQTGSSHRAAT